MNRNSVIATVATMIIVAFKSVSNGADRKYQVVDLGAGYAHAINASGYVVGSSVRSNGISHALVWYNGLRQDLGTLDGDSSCALAINDSGQIVGWYRSGNRQYAYRYFNGLMQRIDTPSVESCANSINNKGQIVGSYTDSNNHSHAFLYFNGLTQDISDTLGSEGSGCGATWINNLSNITGYYYSNNAIYPFLYMNGTMKDISFNLLNNSTSSCINDKGQVVVNIFASDYIHSYLYDGSFTTLGTLGGSSTFGLGINLLGEVVGYSYTFGNGSVHAFIYSNGKMQDLNDMLINSNNLTLIRANRINNSGQIVGYGSLSGQTHAFLLNPIPMEPIAVITNMIPVQKAFGICPVRDPTKNGLVVITHGWQPPLLSPNIYFIDEMVINIINNLSSRNINNWQVFGYKWLNSAGGLNTSDALNNAKQEGRRLGESIVAQGWTYVHLIGHSAGSALIQAATEVIKTANSSIVVHETFLDPFVGLDSGGIFTYGRRADWADQYFSRDELTEVGIVGLPYTDSPTFHSYNVDVSFLDLYRLSYNKFSSMPDSSLQITETCTKYVKTTHGWPINFYMNTIMGNVTSDYAGLGFSLSQEGGNWGKISEYGVGNGTEFNPSVPVRVLGTNLFCTAVTPKTSSYSDFIPDFTQSPIIQSTTGIIEKYVDHVSLLSGSPVWLSTVIIPTNPVNFVSFDVEFTSNIGAQGTLVVMWDTNIIGTLDERFIEPGLQRYIFTFPQAKAYSSHVLGLRLDPFTNVQSVITLANIVFNQVGVSQPFSLSITTNTVNSLRVLRLDGEVGFSYSVQASTNLNFSEWADIAILENTNGVVFFYDTDQNIYNQRFYRVVSP